MRFVASEHICQLMRNSAYRTNILTLHAGNSTGRIYSYGVVIAYKSCRLGTNGYTGSAIYASIPSNIKYHRLLHIFLYSLIGLK